MQNTNKDPPGEPLKGYPKLANLMGTHTGAAIFRRFGALTMLNLMSLQAELVEIEAKLRTLQLKDDKSTDGEKASYSQDFSALHKSTAKDEQKDLLNSSCERLMKYHSLLLQAAKVTQLPEPSPQDYKFLRQWLRGEKEGKNFLSGLELLQTWDDFVQRDLVSLIGADAEEDDDFSKWFKPAVITTYHFLSSGFRSPTDGESGRVYDYEDSKFMKSFRWLLTLAATIIASLFPVLVILWLWHVKHTVSRIWITMGFTAGTGLVLKIFTNATMKEIFAATAAFAAIEVVFIGTANGA